MAGVFAVAMACNPVVSGLHVPAGVHALLVCVFARTHSLCYWLLPESIKWFLEGQTFSRSSDLAPRPPTLSRHQVASLSQSSCVSPGRVYWRKRGGRGAESFDGKWAWTLYKSFSTLRLLLSIFFSCKFTRWGEFTAGRKKKNLEHIVYRIRS